MNIRQAYNIWASQYDTDKNRTRDLEKQALRETLAGVPFGNCLEIGCGTGKNTVWFLEQAIQVTAVDLSEKMLALAKIKTLSKKIRFIQADINEAWDFGAALYNLVSFSLVLEHIQNLDHIFAEASRALKPGGYVYLGELHPFKQYTGTKARFDTQTGRQEVDCFTHHISDFVQIAKKHGLLLVDLNEYFDENDRYTVPRILTILLRKTTQLRSCV